MIIDSFTRSLTRKKAKFRWIFVKILDKNTSSYHKISLNMKRKWKNKTKERSKGRGRSVVNRSGCSVAKLSCNATCLRLYITTQLLYLEPENRRENWIKRSVGGLLFDVSNLKYSLANYKHTYYNHELRGNQRMASN